MASRFLVLTLALLTLTAVFSPALAQASYRHEGGYVLPDSHSTPGAVNPSCVADPSGTPHLVSSPRGGAKLEENICASDFRTAPIRATIVDFAKLKREACAAYGVRKCDGTVEGDHLVSIEICGSPDDVNNLWPQPMREARVKDHQVEDVLPRLICAGKISLAAAQKCIAGDWVACSARIRTLEAKR